MNRFHNAVKKCSASTALLITLCACNSSLLLTCPLVSYLLISFSLNSHADSTLNIELLAQLPSSLKEVSGLAFYDNQLWAINDSGNKAELYRLKPDKPTAMQTVALYKSRNIDWESLAQDDDGIYIADCGNNRGKRTLLSIFHYQWLHLSNNKAAAPSSREINFSYSNRPEDVPPNHHNFDCEAITVVGNKLWLFSKNRADQHTDLYLIDKNKTRQALVSRYKYPVNGLITAADYLPEKSLMALIGYKQSKLWGQSFLWLIPVKNEQLVWAKAKYFPLNPLGQWEAVSWKDPNSLYIATEKNPFIPQYLGLITLPN